MGLTLTVG